MWKVLVQWWEEMRVLVVVTRVKFESVMGEERKVMVLRLLGVWFRRKVA